MSELYKILLAYIFLIYEEEEGKKKEEMSKHKSVRNIVFCLKISIPG